MSQVFRQGELNLASLTNNDVYVLIATPANTSIQGVETGIVGVVGSASWGPFNVPKRLGSPEAAVRAFGAPTTAAKDMPSDIWILQQLRVPTVVGVRVTDGTDAKATVAVNTAATGTVTIAGTPHTGDVVNVTVGGVATSYTTKAADSTAALIASAVADALNQAPAFAAIAFAQANGAVVNLTSLGTTAASLAASVTGTGATVTATASGANLTAGGTKIGDLNALYSGTEGNALTVQVLPGTNTTAAAPTWNVLLNRTGLVSVSELFTNLPEATFAAALTQALANGQGVTRGPSDLARFVAAAGTGAPAGAKASFTGGANGDTAVTTAQQLGTNLAIPATGMYALKGQGVQKLGLCGNTDTTAWPTQLAFAKQIGAGVALCYPANTESQAAVSIKKAVGIDDFAGWLVKDWVQYLDPINNVLRLVSPMPFALGRIASLTPEQSPGNKPIDLVLGTERSLADRPYDGDEAGLLTKNGILFITNPVPGGNYWALRHGLNSSSNPAVNGIEYTNMTNFLAYSYAGAFGEFIDQNQTAKADDPLRALAEQKLNKFHVKIKDLIEDASVDMRFGTGMVNTPDSVKDGFMKAVCRVTYKSVVRFFVVTLVGGKTVDVSIQ